MKELDKIQLQQISGGANWKVFRDLIKESFNTLGDAFSEAGKNIRDDWREIRDDWREIREILKD